MWKRFDSRNDTCSEVFTMEDEMRLEGIYRPFKPEPFDPGTIVKSLGGMMKQSLAGGVIDISPQYEALMQQQMQMHQQMTEVSMRSNLEKARHDARMAVVRNMRVQ